MRKLFVCFSHRLRTSSRKFDNVENGTGKNVRTQDEENHASLLKFHEHLHSAFEQKTNEKLLSENIF